MYFDDLSKLNNILENFESYEQVDLFVNFNLAKQLNCLVIVDNFKEEYEDDKYNFSLELIYNIATNKVTNMIVYQNNGKTKTRFDLSNYKKTWYIQ